MGAAEGVVVGAEDAAFPNRPPAGAGVGAGAVVAAVVPGVVEEAELPIPPKRPPLGAAAGVLEGADVEVAPPREGNMDFWGVAVEVAGAPREGVVLEVVAEEAPPSVGNAGFGAESPPGVALLKRDGVCDCAPPGAAPNNDGLAASGAAEGVLDSAGLFKPPNRPPAGAAAVVAAPPNDGVGAAPPPPPKRLLDGCEIAGVVDAAVEGAAEEGFAAPKRVLGGFAPGGGPAGVVELVPNRLFPTGAGVAVEPAPPNKLPPAPPAAGVAPNNPPPADGPGVVDSAGLLGVWLPMPPNRLPAAGVLPVLGWAPKEKPELPPEGAFAVPVFPPKDGAALEPADEAPTFPKRPPPDALLSLLAPNALPAVLKRPPPLAPVEAGVPKLNAILWCWRGQGD